MGIAGAVDAAVEQAATAGARMGRRRVGPLRGLVAASIAVVGLLAASCAPPGTTADQVAQIISFVEATRGHAFLTHPTVAFIPEAQFVADVLANVDAQQSDVDRDEVAFKALGWMSPTDSLFAKYQVAFGGAVVGFYDPATKVLEVRGTDLTPYRREVIAHELTHALDDQYHDLNVSKGPGLLSEPQLAFLVAVEGSAARVQQAYVGTMTPVEQAADLAEQLSLGSDPALLTVPLALLSLAQMPYLQGPRFTEAEAAHGVPAGLDAVFDDLPATEEEAFDPAAYDADLPPTPVPVPPADGTVVRSGGWGQFLMTLVLQEGVSLDATVNPATAGWAGDAFVTWTQPGQDCIRIDTRDDTVAQATVLADALDAWSSRHVGSSVSRTGDTVRLTACGAAG